ncbi:MAG: AIR synthase-related protein [Candidatus Binatia bacterium]
MKGREQPTGAPLSYQKSGVDYGSLDPVKVLAQRAAAATAGNLARFGLAEVPASRGESAYVWEEPDAYRAFVIEGLGTKNLVADAMRRVTGKTYYDALARDTVAMIVNDVVVVGAEPQVVTAYWAVGASGWFDDRERAGDLVRGWAAACEEVGATWGGGETPALAGIVAPETIDLGGACVGVARPKTRLVLGDRLGAGDAIVLLASSGIHANGLTLARRLAEQLPQGYATDIGDGTPYGEALLAPTLLYPPVVRDLLEAGIDLRYLVNVTGHGWRKLMRARRELRYVLHAVPPVSPLFRFLVGRAGIDATEAYGTFNMGAGFAVYVPEAAAPRVVEIARGRGIDAWVAGHVEAGPREVVIEPLGVRYAGDALSVRS